MFCTVIADCKIEDLYKGIFTYIAVMILEMLSFLPNYYVITNLSRDFTRCANGLDLK